jgi:hypothetical protein
MSRETALRRLTTAPAWFWAAMASFIAQSIALEATRLAPSDFLSSSTIHGLYAYDGGGAFVPPTSSVAGISVFCVQGIWGNEYACGQQFAGRVVSVTLGSYASLRGRKQAVIQITADDGDRLSWSRDELVSGWKRTSILSSLENSVILGVAVYVYSGLRRRSRAKRLDRQA